MPVTQSGVTWKQRSGPTNGLGLRMTLDLTEFNKVMEEYMKFQKRLPADVINAKLYYIARNATMTTKASDGGKIASELNAPSRDYPEAPLGAIIVNSQLGAKNEPGLSGSAMAKALEKLIAKRRSSVNFVRSGWKNAILILEEYMRNKGELNFVKRWASNAPVNRETMKKKNFKNLGKANPARIERSPRVYGEIQNDVGGGSPSGLTRLERMKEAGLQEAVNKEVRSMLLYIERKLNPVHQTVNRKIGGH